VYRSGQGMAPTPGALMAHGAAALEQLEASLASNDFVPLEATDTFGWPWLTPPPPRLVPGLIDILEREAPGCLDARRWPPATLDPCWRRKKRSGARLLPVGAGGPDRA
jgi:hypothetical protein